MTVKGNDTNDCLVIFSFLNKAGNMYSVVIPKILKKHINIDHSVKISNDLSMALHGLT